MTDGIGTGRGRKQDRVSELAAGMRMVRVGPGGEVAMVSARLPTVDECRKWGIGDLVPVLVVRRGDRVDVYPGDRVAIEAIPDE
jgi:hypothetical protein